MNAQNILPTNLISFLHPSNKLVTSYYERDCVVESRLHHDVAYDGGNCLLIESSNQKDQLLLSPIFRCEFSLKTSLILDIIYSTLGELGVLIAIGDELVLLGNSFTSEYRSISPIREEDIGKEWKLKRFVITETPTILTEIYIIGKPDKKGNFSAKIGQLSILPNVPRSADPKV